MAPLEKPMALGAALVWLYRVLASSTKSAGIAEREAMSGSRPTRPGSGPSQRRPHCGCMARDPRRRLLPSGAPASQLGAHWSGLKAIVYLLCHADRHDRARHGTEIRAAQVFGQADGPAIVTLQEVTRLPNEKPSRQQGRAPHHCGSRSRQESFQSTCSNEPVRRSTTGTTPAKLDFIEKCTGSAADEAMKDGFVTEHLIGTLKGEPELSEVTEGAPASPHVGPVEQLEAI